MGTIVQDLADLEVLSRANEKRKFGVPIGVVLPAHLQDALERGMDKQWFQLIDVAVAENASSPRMLRVFRLTDRGVAHLADLQTQLAEAY